MSRTDPLPSARPPSPSLAPPCSHRTRCRGQGAKNFCCAKLEALAGFRFPSCPRAEPERLPDHKAGQRGRPSQSEVIMSNINLQDKAVQAATRFCERKDYEILDTGWTSNEGITVDLVAKDDDCAWSSSTSPPRSTARGRSRTARSPAATSSSPRQAGSPPTPGRPTSRSASTSSTCWS